MPLKGSRRIARDERRILRKHAAQGAVSDQVNVQIVGEVHDADRPSMRLENVDVWLSGTNLTAKTNGLGWFSIQFSGRPAVYELAFVKVGYSTVEIPLDLRPYEGQGAIRIEQSIGLQKI